MPVLIHLWRIRPASTRTGSGRRTTFRRTGKQRMRSPRAVPRWSLARGRIARFLDDADDPAGVVATLASVLAPGSFVAISHLTSDFAPEHVRAGVAVYNAHVPVGITARTHREVIGLFVG